MKLEDATGGGYGWKIGNDNRGQVRAVTEAEVVHNAESGNAYNFNTGYITFSADGTGVYFKNNADNQFILTGIAVGVKDNTSPVYSTKPFLTIVRNPTGGDLISDATAVAANQNRNFGSSKTATGDLYKGKSGGTLTGGDDIAYLQLSTAGRSFFTIDFILPKGSSIGVKLTSALSSGSHDVYFALIGYYKDDQDIG